MKPFILFSFLALLTSCSLYKTAEQMDVHKKNMAQVKKGTTKKEYVDFLVLASDARIMGTKQGQLGQKRATTQPLKDYGIMMEREQQMLLGKIQKLADEKEIILLKELSKKRAGGYKILAKRKDGKAFDLKYMKMMRIDHERDVKEFEKASKFEDEDIRTFAQKYLPTIQKHLNEVLELEKNYKK